MATEAAGSIAPPALINNVETMANVPPSLPTGQRGPARSALDESDRRAQRPAAGRDLLLPTTRSGPPVAAPTLRAPHLEEGSNLLAR